MEAEQNGTIVTLSRSILLTIARTKFRGFCASIC